MDQEEKKLYCHYSDLPSPSAYRDDFTDYDGMGNQGRFPKQKKKKPTTMKRLVSKILLWWSYKWPKKDKRKSIWEL